MFARAAHEEGDRSRQECERVGENDVLNRVDTVIDGRCLESVSSHGKRDSWTESV